MPLDILGPILEFILQVCEVCHFMYNSDLRGVILSLSISCVCVVPICMLDYVFLTLTRTTGLDFLLPLKEFSARIAWPSHPAHLVCTAASHPKQPFHWIPLVPNITPVQSLCTQQSLLKAWHHRAASFCYAAQPLLHPKLPAFSPSYLNSRFPSEAQFSPFDLKNN